jgi:dolichol-phosphate mannosyltransferase
VPDAAAKNPKLVSVVVPIFREEKNVRPLTERLNKVFENLQQPWELVLALDPSPDRTEDIIHDLVKEGFPIRNLRFSRRIGKPLSLIAGLDYAAGDVVIVMDADLQDPPELIADMLKKWADGYDVVIAKRRSRKGEKPSYLMAARLFYILYEKIAEVRIPQDTGDYRLMSARVVNGIRQFRERHGFLRALTASVGYNTTVIEYDRDPRLTGKTQISLLGALNIALDGIVPFSRFPVRMIFVLGAFFSASAMLLFIAFVFSSIIFGTSDKWPFVVLCLAIMLFSGLNLTALGTVGEYLVRNYEETRKRPLYIIDTITESPAVACYRPKFREEL